MEKKPAILCCFVPDFEDCELPVLSSFGGALGVAISLPSSPRAMMDTSTECDEVEGEGIDGDGDGVKLDAPREVDALELDCGICRGTCESNIFASLSLLRYNQHTAMVIHTVCRACARQCNVRRRLYSTAKYPRDYNGAVQALNSLQSNFSIVEAIRKLGPGWNKLAIPEMIGWVRRIGYEVRSRGTSSDDDCRG